MMLQLCVLGNEVDEADLATWVLRQMGLSVASG